MRFRIIRNIIRQGFEGTWRNKGMGIASIGSISAVLLILGIVLILVLGINSLMVDMQAKFDVVQIYLEDDASPREINEIEDTIRKDNRIVSFEFETESEALENLKEGLGENAYILEGLEDENILPNSFIIQLRDVESVEEVVLELREINGVEDIPYNKDVVDKLMEIGKYIRIGGIAITGTLVLVSIFIISNTIKLAVTSREREIGIMKYVGATNSYIRAPFIIEGMIYGLIAAVISTLIINFGYEYLFNVINDRLYTFLSVLSIPPSVVFMDIGIIFLAMGIGIGGLGSIISMRKYLDV